MITVDILKDTKKDIQFILSIDKEYQYFIEAFLMESTDTFSIRAYDNIHTDVNPYNANEVMHGLFDSDGGTFEGFEIEVNLEESNNQELMNILENKILSILFNDRNGLVNKYSYSEEV